MKHEINYLVEFQRVALVVRTSENTVAAKIKIKRKKKHQLIRPLTRANRATHANQQTDDMNERTHLDKL